MPPKKSKKKAKGKDQDIDGLPLTPEDRMKLLESNVAALEMQLVQRSETAAHAIAECEAVRDELTVATQQRDEEAEMSKGVMQSMTRQYKAMQEDLLNKINDRERAIATLKDELEATRLLHKEHIAQKDNIIQQKGDEADQYRAETECVCRQFAKLLADARESIVAQTKVEQ
ncbi:hypothetical protein ACHAXT_000640 [Thalassiosira profunda]